MKFFRSVTQGHVVIMGRKTFESLGKALPNRINIILSTEKEGVFDNTIWAKTPETALYLADYYSIVDGKTEIFVIGGAQIYQIFTSFFTKIYLTEVFHEFTSGDAFFKTKFDLREWDIVKREQYPASDQDEFAFQISVMEKRIKYTRNRDISEFYTKGDLSFDELNHNYMKCALPHRITDTEKQALLPFTKRVA